MRLEIGQINGCFLSIGCEVDAIGGHDIELERLLATKHIIQKVFDAYMPFILRTGEISEKKNRKRASKSNKARL